MSRPQIPRERWVLLGIGALCGNAAGYLNFCVLHGAALHALTGALAMATAVGAALFVSREPRPDRVGGAANG